MKVFKLTLVAALAVLILPLAISLLPDAPAGQSLMDIRSEKSKMMDIPQGYPDMFFEYHHAIRASENGKVEYPVGSRYEAIRKAIAANKTSNHAAAWVERGPGNVGGRTRGLLVDPDDPDLHTYWAGTVGGGLWKTINRGLSWQYQSDDWPIMSIATIEHCESNPDVIYVGTGEGFGNLDAVGGNGIFKSTDRGQTWEHLSSTTQGTKFTAVNRLAVDPMDPDVVLAATNSGIHRTGDGGMTWNTVYNTNPYVQDLRAQPGNFNRLIAGVNGLGIVYSTDAGNTWSLSAAVWNSGPARIELTFASSDPNIAYAAEASSSTLYISRDGGMSWGPTVARNNIPWLGSQGWYDNTLAVDPFDASRVFLGGIHLFDTEMTNETFTVRGPGGFDISEVKPFITFVNFGGNAYGGTVSYLDGDATDVTEMDYTNIEVRFGQGNQKAHRFTVSETGGTFDNGGSGIPFPEYMYADYVEVPLQVWDTDNNRQLMFSFRDQADDGEFNLIPFFSSDDIGTRDQHSREYIFIHKYDYHDTDPNTDIAQDGGLVDGMLYFMWPHLRDSTVTWDPLNLPVSTMTLAWSVSEGLRRTMTQNINTNRVAHVDHHNILPIVVDAGSQNFWLLNANDGGVALSSNKGRTFQELDQAFAGFNTSQFYGVSKKPGSQIYLGGAQDNGTWRSFGNPNNRRGWVNTFGGDGFETVWHPTNPNLVLGSIQYSLVNRSTNGGASWSTVLPYDIVGGQFLTSLGNSDAAPDYVYTPKAAGVLVSDDFGATWRTTRISNDDGWRLWSGSKVRVSGADGNVVWAGGGMASAPKLRLFLSKDKGEFFDAVPLPNVTRAPETYISGLATHPTEAGTAYALFSRYKYAKVLETKDFGQTWTDLSAYNAQGVSENGFPELAVYDLVVMPHAPHVIWVGTEAGIFTSRSAGNQWYYAHNGLPAVPAWRMKVRDDELIVATHGRGIWTLPLTEVAVGVEEDFAAEVPEAFVLSPNYPNPFNPSTTIQFDVPREAQVRLTVFDAAGRRVAVLSDRVYQPGSHEVNWNASDLSSGVYFYRMETDGKIIHTRRMTLLK